MVVVTMVLILVALASIVFTNSYKKLWRSALRNSSPACVVETVAKDCTLTLDKPAEAVSAQVIQLPLEESQPKQENICTECASEPTTSQEKPLETPVNIEQTAATVAVEATQQQVASPVESKEVTPQTNSRARKKRSTTRSRSTKRSRKKVPKAQPITESQPPS